MSPTGLSRFHSVYASQKFIWYGQAHEIFKHWRNWNLVSVWNQYPKRNCGDFFGFSGKMRWKSSPPWRSLYPLSLFPLSHSHVQSPTYAEATHFSLSRFFLYSRVGKTHWTTAASFFPRDVTALTLLIYYPIFTFSVSLSASRSLNFSQSSHCLPVIPMPDSESSSVSMLQSIIRSQSDAFRTISKHVSFQLYLLTPHRIFSWNPIPPQHSCINTSQEGRGVYIIVSRFATRPCVLYRESTSMTISWLFAIRVSSLAAMVSSPLSFSLYRLSRPLDLSPQLLPLLLFPPIPFHVIGHFARVSRKSSANLRGSLKKPYRFGFTSM